MRGSIAVLSALLVATGFGSAGYGQTVPAMTAQLVTEGLNQPVQMVPDPTNPARLFVVQKGGAIRTIENGVLQTTPFLNITPLVGSGGEGGLLGLAFSPDYAASGVMYVHYYSSQRIGMVLARYRRASGGGPVVADPASAETVLFYQRGGGIHYGGWIGFSPVDRLLYISVGNGAGNSAMLNTVGGKILRIDVKPGLDDFPTDSNRNFAIPATNPFLTTAPPDARPEIFAFGVRNPWRCSFDRDTGDLYIGDVGDSTPGGVYVLPHLESPETVAPGLNFGYQCVERGAVPPPTSPCAAARPITTFAFTYERSFGASMTGGFVYRGCAIPEMRGRYLVGDYTSGRFFSYPASAGPTAQLVRLSPGVQQHTELTLQGMSSICEDLYGELYVTNVGNGRLYKFVPVTPAYIDTDGDGIPDDCELSCGPADLGRTGGLPGHDGVLDNNDFIVFIDAFFAGAAEADVGSVGGVGPGDGAFDNNDFVVFVDLFFAGCGD